MKLLAGKNTFSMYLKGLCHGGFMFLSQTMLELKLSILLQTQNALRTPRTRILVERINHNQFLEKFPKHIERT